MIDLKGMIPTKERDKNDYYWALIVEDSYIQAGIWGVSDGKVSLVSHSPAIAWETSEELITSSDAALSSCIQNFPEDRDEPSEVVFGVPGFWVSEGNIKEEYLDKIKKICAQLSLKPAGFVILSEAIAYFIKTEEGAPVTAIVVGMYKDVLEVSYLKIGKLVATTVVTKSVSSSDDVAEGLTRMAIGETFPSRFIIFNAKQGDLENVRQSLMEAKWERFEKVNFLHTPKIELITPENKILAISLAGGLELAKATGIEKPLQKEESPQQTEEQELAQTDQIKAEDVGFVLGEDVSKVEPPQIKEDDNVVKNIESVAQQTAVEPAVTGVLSESQKGSKLGVLRKGFKSVLLKFNMLKGGVKTKLSRSPIIPAVTQGKKLLLIGIAMFVILVVGGFVYWWFVPRATVTIFVSPQKLEDSINISVDEKTASIDVGSNTIPGSFIEETISSDKTKSTSGTKTIGEKAKGEVTIYRSGSELSLNATTDIKSKNGLEFVFDEAVTIASGSASTPGTTKVKVTAVKIGAEYNLASGEGFTVSNYPTSDMEAKSENAFSGGSSREVSVVSEDDQQLLEEDLTKELISEALQKIQDKLPIENEIIKESAQTKVIDKTFDKKVGDETGIVKLSLELKVSVVSVSKKDLIELAKKTLESKVSEGYTLKDDQVNYEFEFIGGEDGKYEVKTNFIANLLPKIDTKEIIRNIAGKYPHLAEDYLVKIKGYKKAEIKIKSSLPGKLKTLPHINDHISIEVEAY